jgi:two-component system nitrate/nitrite response regulator NarL
MEIKKIILADDHPLLLEGLTAIIREQANLNVCATAKNGKHLLQIFPLHKPDLILLDINMPEIDGLEASKIIKSTNPDIKILCISTYYSKNMLDLLREIPVEGFIPKQSDSKDVINSINRVLAGETVFIKNHTETIYLIEPAKEVNILSPREREIMHMIKKGMSTKDIASTLYLSTYTVDTHRKNICSKLNLESPGSLLRFISEKEF